MLASRFDCLDSDGGSAFREPAEYTAGVEPTHAVLAEDFIPIDGARFQLGDGGVSPIGAAQGRTNSESSLGEIQSITDGAANAIVIDPANEALVDAALIDEILKQAADGIIGNGGDNRGVEAETAFEAARDVVFSSTLGDFEGAGGPNAAVAGIKPKHYFAEAYQIPTAGFLRLYGQRHSLLIIYVY